MAKNEELILLKLPDNFSRIDADVIGIQTDIVSKKHNISFLQKIIDKYKLGILIKTDEYKTKIDKYETTDGNFYNFPDIKAHIYIDNNGGLIECGYDKRSITNFKEKKYWQLYDGMTIPYNMADIINKNATLLRDNFGGIIALINHNNFVLLNNINNENFMFVTDWDSKLLIDNNQIIKYEQLRGTSLNAFEFYKNYGKQICQIYHLCDSEILATDCERIENNLIYYMGENPMFLDHSEHETFYINKSFKYFSNFISKLPKSNRKIKYIDSELMQSMCFEAAQPSKSGEKSMSTSTKPEVKDVVIGDLKKGTYRFGQHRGLDVAKKSIIAFLNKDDSIAEHTEAFSKALDTETGTALLSLLMGLGLTYAPKINKNKHVSAIAEEFRVDGIHKIGSELTGQVKKYVLPVLQNATKNLPNQAPKIRVETKTTQQAKVSEPTSEPQQKSKASAQ